MGVYKYCINNDLYNLVKKLKFEYEWRYYNLFELLSNINNKEARNDKFPKENPRSKFLSNSQSTHIFLLVAMQISY